MDRLTDRDQGGGAVCGIPCRDHYGHCDEYQCFWDILNRLAAYEDTGFSPEEVIAIQEALGERKQADWAIEAIGCRKEAAKANLENAALRTQLVQVQTANSELRAALEKWKTFAHFTAMPVHCQTGEPLDKLIAGCIQQGEKALAFARLENANKKRAMK